MVAPSEKAVIEMDDETASTMAQPLLELEDEEEEREREQEQGPVKEKGGVCSVFSDENALPRKARFFGIFTGFLVHTVALGAYAAMIVNTGTTTSEEEIPRAAFLTCLSFLTQLDVIVYVLIWIAFTCTMTGSGMKMIQARLGEHIQRRDVFVLGVYFLVGIVLGAFAAWYMVDSYLGFTVPLVPIVATVVIDLVLCYLMIWCYDVGDAKSNHTTNEVADSV
ncbi:unnamed protein product [Cylindrotheca closterium]|uniref:Uncharacterized protein n=1 Tax=Cylindrotheca closterium TaxID=2856 RepID=A0AAD2G3U6_9STRA|nr:unnamed protein product [Cylindrotheca closterium]